jgi:hypothetical protein
LVAQRHVRARKHIVRNRLPEDLHAKHIRYYLFGFSLNVGVYESDVVIAAYYVAEG